MISRWPLLTLFVVVFAPGLMYAQSADPLSQSGSPRRNLTISERGTINVEKMYEDIEILRRILDRKLAPLYPSETGASNGMKQGSYLWYDLGGQVLVPQEGNTGTLMLGPQGQSKKANQWMANPYQGYLQSATDVLTPSVSALGALEGVYLLGHGVIYSATLSSLQPPAKAEADSTVSELTLAIVQHDSEWDSIRRQVRNEKEKPKKPEESKPPSLSDVLLKVLAENGHHFSQLGENERLTIVLTVHETKAAPAPHRKSGGSGSGGSAKTGALFKSGSTTERQFEVNDLELLGDLHQKQGHYEEALKAFRKAFSRDQHGPSAEEGRRLYRKMAQCYLALGNDEDARKMLNSFSTDQKETADAKDKSTPAAKPAAALPVKLIISAPKKLLDQVKAGKISFDEFRRQASVETLRFGDRR
jgi:tetratricopeptide (TPR) repeat protein